MDRRELLVGWPIEVVVYVRNKVGCFDYCVSMLKEGAVTIIFYLYKFFLRNISVLFKLNNP